MKKVKIGVLGGFRGKTMMNYAVKSDDCEIAAVCDFSPEVLAHLKEYFSENNYKTSFYSDFDAFLESGVEAVVLAN